MSGDIILVFEDPNSELAVAVIEADAIAVIDIAEQGPRGIKGDQGDEGDPGTTTWAGITDKPTTFPPVIGGGATDAVAGNDARLTNARTPTGHAASHKAGGGDAVRLDELAAAIDSTTLDATATAHGLLAKLGRNFGQLRTVDGAQAWSRGVRLEMSQIAAAVFGTGAATILPTSYSNNGTSALPGLIGSVATGSTSAGIALMYLGALSATALAGVFYPANLSEITGQAYLSVPVLSTGAETFRFFFGLTGAHGSINTPIINVVGFRVEESTLKAVCMASGTESTLSWGTAVTAGVPVFIQFRWRVTDNAVDFWANDTSIGTITTNIPASSQAQKAEVYIIKSVGSTSRSGLYSCPEFILYPL